MPSTEPTKTNRVQPLYTPPTVKEANEVLEEFTSFCTAHEYSQDLIEVFMCAMHSDLVDCDRLKRSNMMYLLQKLDHLIPAIYVLFANQKTQSN